MLPIIFQNKINFIPIKRMFTTVASGITLFLMFSNAGIPLLAFQLCRVSAVSKGGWAHYVICETSSGLYHTVGRGRKTLSSSMIVKWRRVIKW